MFRDSRRDTILIMSKTRYLASCDRDACCPSLDSLVSNPCITIISLGRAERQCGAYSMCIKSKGNSINATFDHTASYTAHHPTLTYVCFLFIFLILARLASV